MSKTRRPTGSSKNTTYINNTGRNDIVESRVSYDREFVYFYARTARPLTPLTGKNWMLLYLNTDTLKSTGWEGYEYLVNSEPAGPTNTSIRRFENGKWSGSQNVSYAWSGNEIEVAVPVSCFNVTNDRLVFSFHWADNCQQLLDIREFFLNGDSAPDRRFDYLFTTGNFTSSIGIDRNQIRFYPNPAKKYLNFQWTLPLKENYSYSVFNIRGEYVISGELPGSAGAGKIDLSGCPVGLYVVRIQSDTSSMNKKFQIMN